MTIDRLLNLTVVWEIDLLLILVVSILLYLASMLSYLNRKPYFQNSLPLQLNRYSYFEY